MADVNLKENEKPFEPEAVIAKEKAKEAKEPWVTRMLRTLFSPSAGVIAGSIVAALVLSFVIVAIFDENVQTTAGYLFARPGDFFAALGAVFVNFFDSLFRGAIYDSTASSALNAWAPLTETLTRSAPLILSGLAVAVGFRAGLFNIGVQGQIILGAIFGGYVGFAFNLPVGLHLLLTVLAAIAGGALWGAIPGILKARLGANEVIVTIMLNAIAASLLAYLLQTHAFIGDQVPGKSLTVAQSASYPSLLGDWSSLHWGFIVALLAAWFVWWLIERSTLGFELRAAGANPFAARTAGINVTRVTFLTLVISGALGGLTATMPVLGTEHILTNGTAGTYGFDGITVALLGGSTPLGIVFAGLLFGALNAASSAMQGVGIPSDIVQITQAVIVLFIAASEAVKYRRAKRAVSASAAAETKKKADKKKKSEQKGEAK